MLASSAAPTPATMHPTSCDALVTPYHHVCHAIALYHHICHAHHLPWRLTETHQQSAATPSSPTADDSFAARPRPLGQSAAFAPSPDCQLPHQQALCHPLGPPPLMPPFPLPPSCAHSARDAYPLITQLRLQLPESARSSDVASGTVLHGHLLCLENRQLRLESCWPTSRRPIPGDDRRPCLCRRFRALHSPMPRSLQRARRCVRVPP